MSLCLKLISAALFSHCRFKVKKKMCSTKAPDPAQYLLNTSGQMSLISTVANVKLVSHSRYWSKVWLHPFFFLLWERKCNGRTFGRRALALKWLNPCKWKLKAASLLTFAPWANELGVWYSDGRRGGECQLKYSANSRLTPSVYIWWVRLMSSWKITPTIHPLGAWSYSKLQSIAILFLLALAVEFSLSLKNI